MTEEWYEQGLMFECRRCGRCCTGEPGFVYLEKGEDRLLADFLGIGVREFRRTFTRKVGKRVSLKEEEDGRCIFFDRGCRVYRCRPRQCSTFPFWRWNMARRGHWDTVARECEGMDSGRLYGIDEIKKLLELQGKS